MPRFPQLKLDKAQFLRFKKKSSEDKETQDIKPGLRKKLNTTLEEFLKIAPQLNKIIQLQVRDDSQNYIVSKEDRPSERREYGDPLRGTVHKVINLEATGRSKNPELPESISFEYRNFPNENRNETLSLNYKFADQAHRNTFWAKLKDDVIILKK